MRMSYFVYGVAKQIMRNTRFICAFVIIWGGSVSAIRAQSTTLTTTVDVVDGNTGSIALLNGTPGGAGISLREAIIACNNDPLGNVTYTINIPAGTYTLTITTNNENLSATGDLDINSTTIAGTKTVNLVGAGAGTTIINTAGGWDDRILDLEHVNNAGDLTVNISGITFTGGNVLAGTTSGGAILAGFPNDVTNISNCVFTGNTAPSNGGAISESANSIHNLNLTNCTFTNNTATGGAGGAVSYNGSGAVSITGCTFSGNTAGSQGGAINISGTGAGPTTTDLLRNTFLNNTANGVAFGGAAVGMVNAQTININFNRLFNNNAASVATGKVITTGGGTVTTMNYNNNWWGVNTGPAASAILGTAPTRWLQLKNTGSPTSVCNSGGTSTITASFLSNNLSEAISTANLTTVIGQPITFNAPANGTLSGAQTTIQAAGTATVTFTATTAGGGSANAVFVPATENFTVTTSPTITVLGNNTVTLSSAAGTNNQTVPVNTAITPITYATTGATGATFSGLPTGVSGSWAANVATISGTPSVTFTFPYVVTLTGGCGGPVTANGTIRTTSPTAAEATVSGRITDANGNPVAGAVVRLSGAQSRKLITDADGLYRFDNVETGGFYTVTPSRANYNFNPFNRNFSLVGNNTEAAFTGTSMGDTANPLDTAEYFVRQQYLDILGREPEEAGFNYWSDQILACGEDVDCTRAQRTGVAAAFFIENEFRQSGAFIYNVYESALGRRPVYAEYSADRQQVVGGPTLAAQKQAFAEAFVARAEFAGRYQAATDAASFVAALLASVQQAAGVDVSSQREGLIALYNTGTTQAESRALVLRAVTESAAVREATYNAAFVAVEYFGYLHRGPDQQGYEFWLNVLNTGDRGNYRGMVCSFTTSAEYQRRFSSVVSHSNAECGQ